MPKDPKFIRSCLNKKKPRKPKGKQYQGVIIDSRTQVPVGGAVVASPIEKATTDRNGRFTVSSPEKANIKLQVTHPAYCTSMIPLPKDEGPMLQKFKLEPYPVFSGKVLRAKTAKPVRWCRLLLSGPASRKTNCDRFGRFSLSLAPGKYQLRLREHVAIEGVEVSIEDVEWEPRKVLVWAGELSVPKGGLKRVFKVPPVVKLNVTVSVDAEASKLTSAYYVWLVRASDSEAVCGAQVLKKKGRPTVIYAAEGRYRLLVSGGRNMAAYAGDIEVKGNKPMTVKGRVSEWKHYSKTKDGRVKLLDTRPAGERDRPIREVMKSKGLPAL